jgi:hypothetical protein
VASHPTIRELVEFGLGSVPKSERVEVKELRSQYVTYYLFTRCLAR